jgi:Xaa-Pro aminopeptidase
MERIQLLRELLIKHKVDSYIIPSTDEWQNEYSFSGRLAFLSGFSGSNGILIVTQNDLLLYTDSRYTAQAKVELSDAYTILDMYKQGNCSGMKVCEGGIIGYDPMILTQKEVKYYEKLGVEFNFKLLALDKNLVDILMVDNEINVVEISGEDASVLCKKIINALPEYFPISELKGKVLVDNKAPFALLFFYYF